MSAVWNQTRFGKQFDPVHPRAEDVDFAEMCRTLADINRYSGAASPAISVAYHTLMVAELIEPELKAYALVHDGHEYIIGDITRPTQLALARVCGELFEGVTAPYHQGHNAVVYAFKELKDRLDLAIWRAAGLTPPTPEQEKRIKRADNLALVTEARDFMGGMASPWGKTFEGTDIAPSPHRYVSGQFGATPAIVSSRLYREMCGHLPALNQRAAA